MIQRLRWAAYSSLGAGLIHSIAVGLHAEHASAARAFLFLAVAQVGWGVVALSQGGWQMRLAGAAINGAAIAGWVLTRTTGIAFIDGLQTSESPQVADTVCAALAVISLLGIVWATRRGEQPVGRSTGINAAYVCVVIALVGSWTATGSVHMHDEMELVDGGLIITADGVIVTPGGGQTSDDSSDDSATVSDQAVSTDSSTTIAGGTTGKARSTPQSTSTTTTSTIPATTTSVHGHTQTSDQAKAMASGWPRAYDPSQPVNLDGIEGFTEEQGRRVLMLLDNAKRDLPAYANYATALAAGYFSIGDEGSGHEHLIKYSLLNDDRFLDTAAPESLVYKVTGTTRTLVSAMFIAPPRTAINDVALVNYGGGLLQWHVHDNLCWRTVNGIPKVIGALDANGNCPANSTLQTGGSPMVHVWIAAHPCGPFAALEGVAAGVANEPDSVRVDKCNAAH